MRQAIVDAGLQVPCCATFAELQGLYEEVIDNSALKIEFDAYYPLLPSNSLTDGTLETITSFEFQDGGRMVHDPKLSSVDLFDLTHLLSRMVTFSNTYVHDSMSRSLQKATEALPDIVNKFCEGSRAASGERLKKRALRTALDPKTAPLDCGANASIFRYKGQLGLSIAHQMAPSYRQDVTYSPAVAFTANDLLAASDDSECKAGPTGDNRHICVHIPPVLVLLTLLLFDGLAEHFLVELAERWNDADECALTSEQKQKMLLALRDLVAASGTSWKSDSVGGEAALSACGSVSSLLNSFLVGTERRKSRTRGAPPLPSETKPFREYTIVNPATKMKERLKPANSGPESEHSESRDAAAEAEAEDNETAC